MIYKCSGGYLALSATEDDDVAGDLDSPLYTDQRTISDSEQRLRNRSKGSSFSQALAQGLTGPNLEGGVTLREGDEEARESREKKEKEEAKKGFDYDEIPWAQMFTSPVSLTLFLNNFTYGWIGYMVLTELPSYLTDVLG